MQFILNKYVDNYLLYRRIYHEQTLKEREITTIMGQGSIVKLLGRCWSYFELNIPGTIYIQSNCLWADSRDNSSKLSICLF